MSKPCAVNSSALRISSLGGRALGHTHRRGRLKPLRHDESIGETPVPGGGHPRPATGSIPHADTIGGPCRPTCSRRSRRPGRRWRRPGASTARRPSRPPACCPAVRCCSRCSPPCSSAWPTSALISSGALLLTWDEPIQRAVEGSRSAFADSVFRRISFLGSTKTVIVLGCVLAALAWRRCRAVGVVVCSPSSPAVARVHPQSRRRA